MKQNNTIKEYQSNNKRLTQCISVYLLLCECCYEEISAQNAQLHSREIGSSPSSSSFATARFLSLGFL